MIDLGDIKVSLIVAVANGGVIGAKNTIPWRLPEDMRHFKDKTMNKPIVMGRLTYESLGRPLPGRPNIVLSRTSPALPGGVMHASSVQAGIDLAKSLILADSSLGKEVMIIGGSAIYREAIPFVDKIYLTEIDVDVPDGDAWFEVPMVGWDLSDVVNGSSEANYPHVFKVLSRRK